MDFIFNEDLYERTYAGVLGKIIGVYLGRPFEQWSHERIVRELGEIHYYVHEKLNVPLIVSDDDITGTFTFIRAMSDHGYKLDLTPAQIGHTWLNYIIENKTILWWGGMGTSTEHTAFLRLKDGIEAPASGSIAINGKTVAEQIGAQIFIDGWGMIAAGNPSLAADLAGRAGSVSHDGEAVFAAQVIAAIEAAAFVENNINKLIDIGVSFIPKTSTIYKLIADLRSVRDQSDDWHVGLARIHERYSYQIYDSNCHVVPNHAIVMLGLLWGNGDFDRSMMITCTAGYDTDCNAANVGCILAIRNGLSGLSMSQDWRGPVADRLLLPTADGGSCVSDALTVATLITNTTYRLHNQSILSPKNGSRFHFSLPGSVQGFTFDPKTPAAYAVDNSNGILSLHFRRMPASLAARFTTPTFLTEEQAKMQAYAVLATPTLYSGQVICARMRASKGTCIARLIIQSFDTHDKFVTIEGDEQSLSADWKEVTWVCPSTEGMPIASIGIEVLGPSEAGILELDYLHWSGAPTLSLSRCATGNIWKRAWVESGNGFARWHRGDSFMAVQNKDRGLIMTGARDWFDYRVQTTFKPNMIKEFGLAARIQGLRRYCAILIGADQKARLVEVLHTERVIAEIPFEWNYDLSKVSLSLTVEGSQVSASINGQHSLGGTLNELLNSGGIAIVSEEGTLTFDQVDVRPI